VADCDSAVLQYKFTYPTIAEAARAANVGDYVIAVEYGNPRPLNAEEQADLEQCTARGRMKLQIGQQFVIDGGYAPDVGTVVKIEPPCVYVNTGGWGELRFNADGDECNPDGTQAEGHYLPQFSLPFKLRLRWESDRSR
jgi:hypothetical protein